jgi:hypothetical protein
LTTPIEVRTRTDQEGTLIPFECILGEKTYRVMGIGRRWQIEDGEHLLVMFPGDRVVELLHRSDDTWWLIKDHSAQRGNLV